MSAFSIFLRSRRLSVYGIIMGGWASNSKYPFLGALRSAAQMVSYEVSIGFVIITVLLCVGSLNLTDIVNAQDAAIMACSTGSGCRSSRCSSFSSSQRSRKQTVRHSICRKRNPNSSPASWSNIGSTPYMMFMLGEYVAIVTMCAMTVILFMGGWLPPADIAIVQLRFRVSVWFIIKVVHGLFHVRDGESLRAALPL